MLCDATFSLLFCVLRCVVQRSPGQTVYVFDIEDRLIVHFQTNSYIIRMSREDNLCWFHGKVSRDKAEQILREGESHIPTPIQTPVPEYGLFT